MVDNRIGMNMGRASVLFNSLLDARERVLCQELQDAYVLSGAGKRSMTLFKCLAKFGETGGKLEGAKHVGVVQRSRTTAED